MECVVPEPGLPRVRPVGMADLGAVVRLRSSVGWSSGGLEGSFAAAAAGRQAILVAEFAGEIAGGVTISFQQPLAGPRRGHISDLLVAPLWRRRGLGSALLAAAERLLVARGCIECTLDVDAHNTGALALYYKTGYRHYRPAQFPWGRGYTLKKPIGVRQRPSGGHWLRQLLRRPTP